MRILWAVVVLAGVSVFGGVAPQAQACSCESFADDIDPDTRYGDFADAVFVGIATDRSSDPPTEGQEGLPGTVRFAFDVELMAKGEIADPVEVSTSASDGLCGTDFVLGQRYKVFAARRDDGSLATGSCSGNRPATPDDLVPIPPTSVVTPTTGPAPEVSLPSTGHASRDAAGAALAVVVLGGALVFATRAAPRAVQRRR